MLEVPACVGSSFTASSKRNKTMNKNKQLDHLNDWPYTIDLAGHHRKINPKYVMYVEAKKIVIDNPLEIDQYKELIEILQNLNYTGFLNNGTFTFDKTIDVEVLAFNLVNNEVFVVFNQVVQSTDALGK